jgi:PKD repeat protein
MTSTRAAKSHRAQLLVVAFAALAIALALSATANAATYCVADPACPAGGVPKPTPEAALSAADADVSLDTVRIGPGTYNTFGLGASTPVELVGAGKDATKIVQMDAGSALRFYMFSSVSKLSVHVTQPLSHGVDLVGGADASDIAVTAPDSASQVVGISAEDAGSMMNHVSVDVADRGDVYGIKGWEAGAVRDSSITAGIGIVGGEPALEVRRTVVRASTGLWAMGASLNASNVLITRHPRPQQSTFEAVEVVTGNNGDSATFVGSNLTIDGGDSGYRYGIDVQSINNPNVTTGTASATVTGAVIRRVNTALFQDGDSGLETATLGIAYSSYDGNAVSSNIYGGIFYAVGNLSGNLDPHFVNPAALDYRLRWDSPLLDAGRPTALVSDEDPDLAGHQRVRDSDGNGSAIRDIGAFEYQRLAPSAGIAIAPTETLLGDATSFDAASSSDPDGDPLSYGWAFGDGATSSGMSATHAFGAPGVYQATLTATDPTGLSAAASATASVTSPTQPSPPGGGQVGGDHSAPVLSGLRLSPKTFTARRGSTVTYRLSEQAKLTLVLQRAQRRDGRIVFTRYARAARAGTAGANRMMLKRRLGARRLAPGRYRLTLVARDAAANRSNAVRARFTVRR